MKVRRILALVLSAALAVTALTACTSAKVTKHHRSRLTSRRQLSAMTL